MYENPTPFLSLDKAASKRHGNVCDLGAVLAMHSMSAWVTGYERASAESVFVALQVSHDGIHWFALGGHQALDKDDGAVHAFGIWPARYVRATIVEWPRWVKAASISATVASV